MLKTVNVVRPTLFLMEEKERAMAILASAGSSCG